jgi:hypothetical protein
MNIVDLTEQIQEKLGFTGRDVDGNWGPKTAAGVYKTLFGKDPDSAPAPSADDSDYTSARSEAIISKLDPVVQPYFRAVWHQTNKHFAGTGSSLEMIASLRALV